MFSLVSPSFQLSVLHYNTLFFTRCFFHLHIPKDIAQSCNQYSDFLDNTEAQYAEVVKEAFVFDQCSQRLFFLHLLPSFPSMTCHGWGKNGRSEDVKAKFEQKLSCLKLFPQSAFFSFCVFLMLRNKEHVEFLLQGQLLAFTPDHLY